MNKKNKVASQAGPSTVQGRVSNWGACKNFAQARPSGTRPVNLPCEMRVPSLAQP